MPNQERIIGLLLFIVVVIAIAVATQPVSWPQNNNDSPQFERVDKNSWIRALFGPINFKRFRSSHQIAYLENII